MIIVSTRPDGGVSFNTPFPEIMSILTLGGAEEGYSSRVDRDAQIAAFVRDGIRETIAVRWFDSVVSGGLTDAEAYDLIKDRTTKPDWTGHELWEASPTDRWFRNAWKRSPNGGPIYVDLERARPVQFKHIKSAIDLETKRRASEIDLFDVPVEVDLVGVRQQIYAAQDEIELRQIWPVI